MDSNFMTPDALSYVPFGNSVIELSEGTDFEHNPIFGLTHRLYDKETDKFNTLGFSRLFSDKEELIKSANLLKETNLCTTVNTKEQESFCDGYLEDVKIPYELEKEAIPLKYPSGAEIPPDVRTNLYRKYLGEILKR